MRILLRKCKQFCVVFWQNYDASRKFLRQISPLFFDGGVTLFWSMRYLPSADGPLNVFFKLPVTEISQVDDHKSVSLPSFKISFKISQVDSHKSVSLPFLEVSRRMSEQRRYIFHECSWEFKILLWDSLYNRSTVLRQLTMSILRQSFSSIQQLCIILRLYIHFKKDWKH